MEDICLLALNAKYIHTNLAVRCLKAYGDSLGRTGAYVLEYTINHPLSFVLDEVYRRQPRVVLLSCYIWNIEEMLAFAREYKKLCPQVQLAAGGPEVSFGASNILANNPALDWILAGEGEIPFAGLLAYLAGERPICQVPGLVYREEGGPFGPVIRENPQASPLPLEKIPFPYQDLGELDNRILYFESIRGCPFRCSYCLSSLQKEIRYLPVEESCRRLQIFLDAGVRQVKFVDRTFNCSKAHAMAIWRYLAEHDNGMTNFHFELTAHLLDGEMLDFLKTVRQGLFQFEIGVQSTNPETIRQIQRTTNTGRLLDICREIEASRNIHLHLDLIAGLPCEGLEQFGQSFDQVFAIRPQQLQLGFLKVLKGSRMAQMAGEYGMVYSTQAPYQVYTTRWLNYREMLLLKQMEEMVDIYYNSGLFCRELEWMLERESSPFAFFLELGRYYVQEGYHLASQGPEARHTILKDFFLHRSPQRQGELERLEDLCLYDICLHGKPKKLPNWVPGDRNLPHREEIRRFLRREGALSRLFPGAGKDDRQLGQQVHLQCFCHRLTGQSNPVQPGKSAVLFYYGQRDLLGHAQAVEVTQLLEGCPL